MKSPNKPYVKKYDSKGNLLNPITKENPFITHYPNRKKIRIFVTGKHTGISNCRKPKNQRGAITRRFVLQQVFKDNLLIKVLKIDTFQNK